MSVEGNIRNAKRMYIPAEDSYLLVETVERYSGKKVLEVGVGSGIITKELSKNFEVVIGTDSNLDPVIFAKGSLSRKTHLICCNMCDTIRSKFDLIVSNPPYLRDLRIDHEKDTTIDGGSSGIEWSIRFLKVAASLLKRSGKILILASSMSDLQNLHYFLSISGLKFKQVNKKKLFFEILLVLEITKS